MLAINQVQLLDLRIAYHIATHRLAAWELSTLYINVLFQYPKNKCHLDDSSGFSRM